MECRQLEERKELKRCQGLTNPTKCRANGWCGLFQNTQSEVLAGAASLAAWEREALRRSSDQLLCAASSTLKSDLSFVGLVEHYDASVCLLLHTFGFTSEFDACCRRPLPPHVSSEKSGPVPASSLSPSSSSSSFSGTTCPLLALKTEINTAQDRGSGRGSGRGGGAYLESYLHDDQLLAALYDGNRIDCELYATAKAMVAGRLIWMEKERNLVTGTFSAALLRGNVTSSDLCEVASRAYQRKSAG